MTNPNDGVGTNAGFNGRTTPKALNDILQGWNTAGIISGWACSPKSGMTIQIGGNGSVRDAAIAENNAGDRTTINNRLASPVEITLGAAPATGNRYDSIVAYVDGSQIGTGASDVDFPSITGIIAVSGTAASTPTKPTAAQIRTAITADGADGTTAYYVVLADIYVGQGVTTIGSGVISAGTTATPANVALDSNTVATANIQNNAVTGAKINWATLGAKYASGSTVTNVNTTDTTMLTISLDAGTWALFGASDFNSNNTDIGACYVGFNNQTTNSAIGNRFYFDATAAAGQYWKTFSPIAVATLTGTSTVALISKKAQGTLQFTRCQIIAIRIA